jgi:hypothetical protein
LSRARTAHGVINNVVEPTSILVTRGARRAKTDRLDAVGRYHVMKRRRKAGFVRETSSGRNNLAPRSQRRGAKHAMRLS